ncbi:MAG TPA: hypothetical protein VMV47_13730 [Bacteroidales bacterium]|nr:hypothetical protein [Bacteroidales bacterium]
MKKILDFSSRSYLLVICILFTLLFASCGKTDQTREYGWFEFVIPDLDSSATVVDMSFLNSEIAGSSGFIAVKDGHFVDGTGKRIRFFGTNLTFNSCFPDKATAVAIAARLKKLGMNVVRFHHMDNHTTPGGIWDKEMKDLDTGQLEKLDWLVYQLKLHGIYSNLNTHVSRTYPGALYEDVPNFLFGKAIDQFYRPYIEMQKEYARKLLTHKNPYTGNTYADEPCVAFVEVNNENSLLDSWRRLPDLKPEHKQFLIGLWKDWLKNNPSYKSKPGSNSDLIGIIKNYEKANGTSKEMLWRFLMDTELSYAKEMTDYYRNDLKIHAMICESQASYSGAEGVRRESIVSDFIDMHAYWEHPRFPGRSWSSTDWNIRNSSMVADKKAGTLSRFAQHRVEGKPLTITEYDHPAPNFFCAEMYPMLNSVAAFQDFDGIYHFTFDAPYDKGRIDNFFSSAGHPLKQIFIPVGAALFRMGEVKSGTKRIVLGLPDDAVASELVKTGEQTNLRVTSMNNLWTWAGSDNALTIMRPMSVDTRATELKISEQVSVPSGPWISETGEIEWDTRDSVNSVFSINAPAAKGAIGYVGGKNIELGNVSIQMDSTKYNWATITLTALDGKAIEESSRILLIAAGRVENTGWKWDENFTTLGDQWGNAPTTAEGIPARLIFRDMKGIKVSALDPAGKSVADVGVIKKGSNQVINIGAQYKTLWYIITR